jgi:hypothetical protein
MIGTCPIIVLKEKILVVRIVNEEMMKYNAVILKGLEVRYSLGFY